MPSVQLKSWRRALVPCLTVALVGSTALSACTSSDAEPQEAGEPGDRPEPTQQPVPLRPDVRLPGEETTVVAGDGPSGTAVATSAALYDRAPLVVLAGEGDRAAQARASSVAVGLGAPLLLAPGSRAPAATRVVGRELRRLDPRTVLAVDENSARWAEGRDVPVVAAPGPDHLADLADRAGGTVGETQPVGAADLLATVAGLDRDGPPLLSVEPDPPASGSTTTGGGTTTTTAAEPGLDGALPDVAPPEPLDTLLVLVSNPQADLAAAATARASGARVAVVHGPDPRADRRLIAELAERPAERVVAVGDVFGPPERLRQRLDVAETALELPGGGQVMFPGRRMAALYGHPGTPAMGVLGEQPVAESIARAEGLAAQYGPLVDEPVVPAFEIIATVASGAAGPDGDYSAESSVEELRPWIDAAGEAGVYVVLDLQPGRSDFLTQAQRYEELLAEPHVGLALDPEWRLGSDQRHLEQVGSVAVEEINSVATWLADLTRDHDLPQKLLLIHQFRTAMITDRASLETSRDELAVLIHADGFGMPSQKFATWNALHVDPPPGITWGWKNFIDEDSPTFTPQQTVAIEPSPVFVSYQ
jgi:hypothetical protein